MTGGQSAIGGGTPWNISKQLTAEGVKKVFVISDEPEQFSELKLFADGVTIAHRDEMIPIQKQLREIEGVTAIIYVQTCATELRRRRKRGYVEDRERKIFVNPDVCEGCGDCAEKSNCVGVKPLKHFDGEKKQIDQSICNKDYSCIKGFCPSFVSIPQNEIFTENKKSYPALPNLKKYFREPNVLNKDINLVMAGIGGTGVSTVSAIIVMACRIENKWAQTMNFTGLAQKNGAVTSQIRISSRKNLYEKSARLPNKSADLLLGCDAVVSVSPLITRTLNLNKTKAVINGRVEPVGVSGVYTGTTVDDQLLKKHLENHLNSENIEFINMSDLAEKLVGDTVSANIMLLGYALQKGFLPISNHALEKAIKLNGVSIQQNLDAFNWGRLLVSNRSLVFKKAGLLVEKLSNDDPKVKIKKFHNILSDYQDDKYAKKYSETIEKLYAKEKLLFKNKFDFSLTKNSALMLFRFMRYKDEYEVARLHTSGGFAKSFLNKKMKKNINFYLAPPLLNIRDKNTGHLKKIKFGSWMFYVFKLLSKLKFLRGTKFDLFGQTNERKKEVALAKKSLLTIDIIIKNISRTNYNICEDLLNAALNIKGYGHVKEKNIKIYEEKWNSFLRKIDLHSVKKVS
jgi:indolepyruvate ferredoxin oxidoreductase